MRCIAATLTEFAADPHWLGGIGAFTLVLHTRKPDRRYPRCGRRRTLTKVFRIARPATGS